jgi:hypothetical protein
MNNERYNQIIDDAYKNFKNNFPMKKSNPPKDYINSKGQLLTKEEFIDKCKTDNEFSKKWGLKIEERLLSLKERLNLVSTTIGEEKIRTHEDNLTRVDKLNISTRTITVTYNNKTIEVYE